MIGETAYKPAYTEYVNLEYDAKRQKSLKVRSFSDRGRENLSATLRKL